MTNTPKKLTIRRPDDWHVHFRDQAMMRLVMPYTAAVFARAIVMPNLKPPITTKAEAAAYRQRILDAVPEGLKFTPLMTLYLTDEVDVEDLRQGFEEKIYTAAKLYPAHATTNSAHGVRDIAKLAPAFKVMEKIGMPLLLHGEVTAPETDIFDREKIFIDTALTQLLKNFPGLKIVLEHITTRDAVDFIKEQAAQHKLGATITPHHLHINRNAMFDGGIRPHFYCLPVAKREEHRKALIKAATSGAACFFLGTDTAPHTAKAKESACGCAGIFCAPHALEDYVQIFDMEDALDRFEAFASLNGPRFYGLAPNEEKIYLVREEPKVRESIITPDNDHLVLFAPNIKREWRIETIQS
jgi:dihydroorotase